MNSWSDNGSGFLPWDLELPDSDGLLQSIQSEIISNEKFHAVLEGDFTSRSLASRRKRNVQKQRGIASGSTRSSIRSKKRKKTTHGPPRLDLRLVNVSIKTFLFDETSSCKELKMGKLSSEDLIRLKGLTDIYNMDCMTDEQQETSIIKLEEIRTYNRASARAYITEDEEKVTRKQVKKKVNSAAPKGRKKGKEEIEIVGEHAEPLDETNKGHLLLTQMGWNGGGLGSLSNGITEPLPAIIKRGHHGLGY